jgi:hypothetical protein
VHDNNSDALKDNSRDAAMKEQIQKSLRHLGIEVRQARWSFPIDFTEKDAHPLSAFYKANGRSFFARVKLEQCRHLGPMAAECELVSQSPYVRTLVEYANGSCTTYAGSWLETVHRRFQPQSAAEFMGVEQASCSELNATPPRGALQPWERFSPGEKADKLQAIVLRENRENSTRLGLEAGDMRFGPTSREKGELEFRRLVNVYHSIKNTGYQKNQDGTNNIDAIMLLSNGDNQPRFSCVNGHHRLAALAALGYRYVDIQMRTNPCGGIIRRADADYWPTVRAGYLSREEALAMFDRLFRGEPPIGFTRAMRDGVNH